MCFRLFISSKSHTMKKVFPPIIVILSAVLPNGSNAPAMSQTSDILKIFLCTDFEVTGHGTSAEWEKTAWIALPQRTEKAETYVTTAKVLYSPTGMYFLFDCQDRRLVSTMRADNLHLWEEDVVEVFLWPSEDFPVYFEYEISPYNFELPIMVPNDKGKFLGWLPWDYEGNRRVRHATSIKPAAEESQDQTSGWVAEFFIPFELLKPLPENPPVSGTVWRANLYRIDYDQGSTAYSWKPTRVTFHDLEKFGTIIFE